MLEDKDTHNPLFANEYAVDGFFDEMFDHDGNVRPHYRRLYERFRQMSPEQFEQKRSSVDLSFLRQGITFTVYNDDAGTERIFPFDLVPRIIPKTEWEHVENGLKQRLTALNMFLNDIYHQQKIIKDNVIPAHYIFSCKEFRRELVNVDVPKGIYIHICGTDIIRGGDGAYLVLEDNARCPSGVSYVLENRQAIRRAFPELFSNYNVRSVSDYASNLRNTLAYIAPDGRDNPTIVVLTPGVHNSAYFEHCFIARQMGVEIVEGRDLCVRDSNVFMRTTKGLQQVDVIYRRLNDDFLDPSVFRRDSLLGVPGLFNAYRSGNVAIANALGAGACDDKVIYYFVPKMIKYYLDQDPILPNVETYMANEEEDMKYILEHMPELVVKAANEAGGYGMLVGPASTKDQIEAFREKVKANPRNYIAQPTISLSRCPTYTGDNNFEGRHIDLRPFVLMGEQPWVSAGGLTRVALRKGSLVVNSSQGGGSKDTWILHGDE